MNSFGIMSLSLEHEKSYIQELAQYGADYQFTVYHFVPSGYNPITSLVKGKKFQQDTLEWTDDEFPIPSILYDRCFYQHDSHSEQCKSIVAWLKKQENIAFIGNGLPNKWTLYTILRHSPIHAYLPNSACIQSVEDVQKIWNERQPIIIKPINGSQGNGVFFIEKRQNGMFVKTDKKEKQVEHLFTDTQIFTRWLHLLLSKTPYMMQTYLPLSTKEKEPFDIRSFLQKNADGEWTIIEKGVRIGEPNRIISNMSVGASVQAFQTWLESYPYKRKKFLEQEIKDILTKLPNILETSFPSLFELGVDIGITEGGALWILDINSKPGRKVILTAYPELCEKLYKAPLAYAQTILNKERRKKG